MKKLSLAGFWIAQYIFGIAAIVAIHNRVPLVPIALLAASYFSTMVGGKVLGIGPNMQQSANERVPSFVEGLWKITCLFVIVILTLNMTHLFNEIGGFNFPLTAVHGLVIFYLMASLRDFFLVRFYFSQDF